MRAKHQLTNPKAYKLFAIGLFSFLISYIAASVFMPVEYSSATDISDTQETNLQVKISYNPVAYYLNVNSAHASAEEAVSLNYGASETNLGNVIASSDTVSTKTNSPYSRYLYLSSNSDSNALSNAEADASISAGGGDTLAEASALSDNTWGFALPSGTSGLPDGANFDADYSSSSLSNDSTFAKVPVSGSEILVQQASGSGDKADISETTSTADVYYGVKGTSSLFAGKYSNTVKYTAYAEAPDQLYPYPKTIDLSDTSTSRQVLIYTAIATTEETLSSETATVEFYSGAAGSETILGTCTSPTLALTDNNFVTVSCTAPEISASGTYGVKVTFTNMGRVVSVEDSMTYTANKVTVTDGTITSGSFSGSASGYYAENETVSISADACATNYIFDYWTVTGATLADASSSSTSFTMPSNPVSINRSCRLYVITSCSQLSTNSTGILKGYSVQKLADGKCWQSSDYRTGVTWDNRGSCPTGFTFPTSSDFVTLLNSVGSGSELYGLGWFGFWWSSTEHSDTISIYLYVYSASSGVGGSNKTTARNVRCYAQ